MARILLVEDEAFVRELYSRILRQSGFEVSTVSNSKEALEKFEEKWADLILLDIQLSEETNGIELLKKLKSNKTTKEIPVLMLTNVREDEVLKEVISLGAQGYMIKMKTTPYELVAHIKEFLQTSLTPTPVIKK